MSDTVVRRSRVILLGLAVSFACAGGLPLVAGAVGLDSPISGCKTVGANSTTVICYSAATPKGAPETGAGGASHSSDVPFIAGGGVALFGAAASMGLALRRRPARRGNKTQ